jgi:hypothetical protein
MVESLMFANLHMGKYRFQLVYLLPIEVLHLSGIREHFFVFVSDISTITYDFDGAPR